MRKYPHVKSPGYKGANSKEMKTIVITNNEGITNVIPILSIGTKMIVFRTKCLMTDRRVKELEQSLTDTIGIKCVVIDPHTELAAVVYG